MTSVPHDNAPYAQAPPPERESAWLADPARRYLHGPRLRGAGHDSDAREYALRRAAAADRAALADPAPAALRAAEAAADALWFEDGWDENWEGRSRRGYVRWAYGHWLTATSAPRGGVGGGGVTAAEDGGSAGEADRDAEASSAGEHGRHGEAGQDGEAGSAGEAEDRDG
ncbi:hypothetical protein POF50_027545 [Streptomyces sp. SL13]|uniref:Uncharacterized protein n=1 Tax=Streptantibioticus silvisoli TaxID=2705255 RepID=A0AA90H8Y0_9ACTN|nr:hypothetical protein [Streptantibioticus silvisoli]MDI5973058.1 hypothetical protein [Streptantibioticus silvisoli]